MLRGRKQSQRDTTEPLESDMLNLSWKMDGARKHHFGHTQPALLSAGRLVF
ncbi:hypothetical protein LEMLEM_LOCUS22316 [Lemmus lemmus]